MMYKGVLAFIRFILNWTLKFGIVFIIVFAVFISVFRIALSKAVEHNNFKYIVKHVLHKPVEVAYVSTEWNWFEPQIHLDNLTILDQKSGLPQLAIDHLVIQVNLFKSLFERKLDPEKLIIDGVQLTMKKDQNGYYVEGFKHPHHHASFLKLKTIYSWLVSQPDLEVKHVNVAWMNDELSDVKLLIHNRDQHHSMMVGFDLVGDKPFQFNVIVDSKKPLEDIKNLSGNLYVSAKHLSKSFYELLYSSFPKLHSAHLPMYTGDIQFWGRLSHSYLKQLIAQYHIDKAQFGNWQLINDDGAFKLNRHQDNTISALVVNQKGQVFAQSLYQHPLNISHLVVQTHAKLANHVLNLRLNHFNIMTPLIHLVGAAQLQFHKKKPPIIDLLAQFSVPKLSRVKALVPQKITKPGFNKWINQAFLKGSFSQGVMVVRGRLKKGFMQNRSAVIEMSAAVNNVLMSYAKHWPLAKVKHGFLTFSNDKLSMASDTVMAGTNTVDHLHLDIPHISRKHHSLYLQLHSKSNLNSLWQYIEKTPTHLAGALQGLRFGGLGNVNLSLKVPMHKKPHKDVESVGEVSTTDGTLRLPRWDFDLDAINGKISFKNNSFFGDGLLVHSLGGQATVNLGTIPGKNHHNNLAIRAHGTINLRNAAQHISIPLMSFFNGQPTINVKLILRGQQSTIGNELHINSNLVGVSTQDIPLPFAKTAVEKRPLNLDISFFKDKPVFFHLDAGKLISLAMVYHQSPSGLIFRSGNIMLGGEKAHYLKTTGLVVNGRLGQLNWDDWQIFLRRLVTVKSSGVLTHVVALKSLKLFVHRVTIWKNQYRDMAINLMSKKAGWHAALSSKKMTGTIFVPHDFQKQWHFVFKRLFFNSEKSSSLLHSKLTPQGMPPLLISIANFNYDNKPYGSLYVKTTPLLSGLTINHFQLNSKKTTLKASGYWKIHKGLSQTFLKGDLSTSNLGNLLLLFHKKPLIADGEGKSTFSFWWAGSPFAINAETLIGLIDYQFKDGSFVAVGKQSQAKIGLARVISFFSVESLFRRLEFKFSDLTNKGLWFDEFSGEWSFGHGAAITQNTLFSGPTARVQVRGQLSFKDKSSNLWFEVTPQLTSSLPAVVGVLGGPIAGVAAWVANKLIGPEINKISASTYHMTGKWGHPKIIKV